MEGNRQQGSAARRKRSEDPQPGGVVKRRGRPRLPLSNEESVQQRRAQIRHAQNTYRMKKDVTISTLQEHILELETKARTMAERFSTFYDRVVQAGLQETDPVLEALLRSSINDSTFKALDGDQGNSEPSVGTTGEDGAWLLNVTLNNSTNSQPVESSGLDIFGYQCQFSDSDISEGGQSAGNKSPSSEVEPTAAYSRTKDYSQPPDRGQPSPTEELSVIEKQFQNTNFTYSFQETTFSRRLHRYSLEYAYRIFSHPASEPGMLYRIFRLVSCIADKTKMKPYFLKLLKSGQGERLEIPSLPFYTIGRAATHYPRKNESGELGFPSNLRQPKRILGSLPCPSKELPDYEEKYQQFLDVMGYGGVWFDSHDVEAYLSEQGIFLNSNSSLVALHEPSLIAQFQAQETAYDLYTTPVDADLRNPPLQFDVQRFLDHLIGKMVALGRAPGFRKSEVDMAIKHAIVHVF